MFGRKSAQQCREEARRFVASVRPEVDRLIRCLTGRADQAGFEVFGNFFLLYLARESADMKSIKGYIGDAWIESLKVYSVPPEDRKKRLDYMYLCLDMLEKEEKALRRRKVNPIEGLLQTDMTSGLREIIDQNPGFVRELQVSVNSLIDRLNLVSYKPYKYAVAAAPQPRPAQPQRPAPAQPQRPAPAAEQRRVITLRNGNGEEVQFMVMDVLPYLGKRYACLLAKGAEHLMIMEMRDLPNGSASYVSVSDNVAELVFNMFAKRHPEMMG